MKSFIHIRIVSLISIFWVLPRYRLLLFLKLILEIIFTAKLRMGYFYGCVPLPLTDVVYLFTHTLGGKKIDIIQTHLLVSYYLDLALPFGFSMGSFFFSENK